MPLNRSCSLDALRDNIAAEIGAGKTRDQAVALAHTTLRQACEDMRMTVPTDKDVGGVAREFKRGKGERGNDYLEEALAEAKRTLPHRQFAQIHHAARSRAGGKAAARARMTPTEKAMLLGPESLTMAEMVVGIERALVMKAADLRLDVDSGAALLLRALEREFARRSFVAKSDPGSGDAHVPSTDWQGRKKKTKKRRPDLYESDKADRSGDPGVMIALRLPANTADAIAVANGEPADRLHVTLAYLGRLSRVGTEGLALAKAALGTVAYNQGILRGVVAGIGRFAGTESSDGKDVIYASIDVPGLAEFRRAVVCELQCCGLEVSLAHDFTPHATLAYVEPGAPTPRMADALRLRDVYFDQVVLAVNDMDTVFALGKEQALLDARMQADILRAREAGDAAVPSAPAYVVQTADGYADLECEDGGVLKAECAGSYEPGDMVEVAADMTGEPRVEGPSLSTVAAGSEAVMKAIDAAHEARLHKTPIPFTGPDAARVIFVAGAPSELEFARREALVGPDGVTFAERYLSRIGVNKSEVAIGFACPVLPREHMDKIGATEMAPWREWVGKALSQWPTALVVALGRPARDALGERAQYWLPHPTATRLNGERGYEEQVERKLKQIAKALDGGPVRVQDGSHRGAAPDGANLEILTGRIGETLAADAKRTLVRVAKAADEKQIVYGVVLDPYEIDTQGEWVPPAVIEATSIDYMRNSRAVGREHTKLASAEVVASWCEEYPSTADYKAAHALQPHRAYERPYGDSVLKSGQWVLGVKLGNAEWAAFKAGEITGFSIGAFTAKTRVSTTAMPSVDFVKLTPTG